VLGLTLFTCGLLRHFHEVTPRSPYVHPALGSLLFAAVVLVFLVSIREETLGAVPGKGVRFGSVTPILLMLLVEKWISIGFYGPAFRVLSPAGASEGIGADASTRIFSVDSSHQQIVVVGVAVARGRDHGERDRLGVKRAARGRSPDPAAASLRSVRRDLLSSLARTFGEEARDLARELALERDVFARSPFRCALALTRPCVLVPQALGLGLLDRGHLDEHALAFIPPAGAAEANDDTRQPTVLPGTARQCRVSCGQEDEMCKISARHAHGSAILHHQQALICASATGADPAFQRRDDHEIR
jgi:hypothetical protein